MGTPITIELTIDLDKHLANHVGYDEEGDPVQGPTTVEDVILGMVADKLVERVTSGIDDYRSTVRDRVAAIRDEEIRKLVAPAVNEAFEAPIRRTNDYGVPTGPERTLHEEIVTKATEWLTSYDPNSRYGDRRLTRAEALVKEQVDRAMNRELSAAIGSAKAEVIAAVQAKGAEVLAKTIADMAKGS